MTIAFQKTQKSYLAERYDLCQSLIDYTSNKLLIRAMGTEELFIIMTPTVGDNNFDVGNKQIIEAAFVEAINAIPVLKNFGYRAKTDYHGREYLLTCFSFETNRDPNFKEFLDLFINNYRKLVA